MKILLICPTRKRRQPVVDAITSFLATSRDAELVIAVDEDDSLYDGLDLQNGRVSMLRTPTQGPGAALNYVVGRVPADVYGMIPDDGRIETPGWESCVLEAFSGFRAGIGALSPAHAHGSYMQFPFVSRRWIEVLGWFAHPSHFHFCWDTILEMLGDATQIAYPSKEQFYIRHDCVLPPHNYDTKFNEDCQKFLAWCVTERRELVQKLREAIANG